MFSNNHLVTRPLTIHANVIQTAIVTTTKILKIYSDFICLKHTTNSGKLQHLWQR